MELNEKKGYIVTQEMIYLAKILGEKMKKLFLFIPLFLFSALHASDWKFSITLGAGSIDYEEDRLIKTVDESGQIIPLLDNGVQVEENVSDTYTPSIIGFSYGNGKHTLGYKITSASASDYDFETSDTQSSGYIASVADRDYDETTISYQYRFNSSWTLGVAYNDKEHERRLISAKTYPATFIPDSFVAEGETADYTWTRNGRSDISQDGFAVYATWQQPISNVWVFAAKIGVSQTDLDSKFTQVRTITGIPVAFNQLYIDGGAGSVNDSTITYAGFDEGDATTVYGGVSFVRIFPSAPNHQIIFSIDGRSDDLAGSSFLTTNGVGTGFFAQEADPTSGAPTGEAANGGADIEEYNLKYTLEYKYTF